MHAGVDRVWGRRGEDVVHMVEKKLGNCIYGLMAFVQHIDRASSGVFPGASGSAASRDGKRDGKSSGIKGA